MNVLGIIPARSGSKRLEDKNIKLLNNKPLIQYTIETALNASSLNRIILSTDSKQYGTLAKSIGAEVPFLRPENISKDDTPDKPVLQHTLKWLRENESYIPDAVAILRPTSPLRSVKGINAVINKFINQKLDSIRTVTKAEGVHHPYWMYSMEENGKAIPFDKEKNADSFYQSQLLPPIYRLNGLIDIISTETILKPSGPLYGSNMHLFETDPLLSIDIDTEYDFIICEALVKQGIISN